MGPRFQDRSDAGRFLAGQLRRFHPDANVVVLALPPGGIPVGYEVARVLKAPLDVFMVRKLSVPGFEELALGAIASGGVRLLNEEMIQRLHIHRSVIEKAAQEAQTELERDAEIYRGRRDPVSLNGRRIILVDDGMATGASMRAAVRALKAQSPGQIIVAVPIGSREACDEFREETVICPETPDPFFAVGTWYSNFIQPTDEEIRQLLA